MLYKNARLDVNIIRLIICNISNKSFLSCFFKCKDKRSFTYLLSANIYNVGFT